MSSYIIIFFGAILGMLLTISVRSVSIQIGSKYELDFVQAFKVYTTKYTGPIVVGLIMIAIAMFIFPDFMASTSAGKYSAIVANVLRWLRICSVGVGILAQGAGFLIVRKGDRYLRDAEEQNKIKISSNGTN